MNIFGIKNNVIEYTVNKADNKGIYISVQNGEVLVNAPWYVTSNQIQEVVEQKRKRIIEKLNEYELKRKNINKYIYFFITNVLFSDFFTFLYNFNKNIYIIGIATIAPDVFAITHKPVIIASNIVFFILSFLYHFINLSIVHIVNVKHKQSLFKLPDNIISVG